MVVKCLSSTSYVTGSILSGNEFPDWVKKIVSPLHTLKHGLRPGPAVGTVSSVRHPHGTSSLYVRVGEGFRGFLSLREVFFYFAIPWGRSYPLQVEFFSHRSNRIVVIEQKDECIKE
jgi:hypothetical protein